MKYINYILKLNLFFFILIMGDRFVILIYVVDKGLFYDIYVNVNNRCIYEKIFGFIFLGFYCYFIFYKYNCKI